MKVTTTSFIDPVLNEPIIDEKNKNRLSRAWTLWLLPFARRTQFNAVDTSSGSGVFTLPLARKNQNVELVYKKTTGDANVATPAASPGDAVDDLTPLALGALSARYLSDGVSTWHRV